MIYLGDYLEDYATLNFKFLTLTAADVPTTLAGTPVISVYKANGLTQSTAGITLTVDFDTVTGLNNVLIDLSSDAFYATGNDYHVVITTGTVSGVSWVGRVIGIFSIQNRSSSLNTTALAALEDQFDGTGLTGDTYPSTQEQIGSLAVGSAAISTQAESYTLTTGTQSSGTISDTETQNAVYHEHTDTAGALELYYQFDVTGAGIGTEVTVIGRMNDANDNLDGLYAYDWVGSAWDRIGDYAGQGSTTDTNITYSLLIRHTGTGANLGKIRVRFYAASGITSGTLHVDQIFASYSVVSQTVGYANGAVWGNTVTGTAGTENYINGVADNPSLTLADMVTISGNLSLHNFEFSNDSSITFVSTHADHVFKGKGYTIALGGQACVGSHMIGATVSGIATTSGDEIHFTDCEMGTCTLGAAHLEDCGLTSTITLSEATIYTLQTCHSEIAGTATPIINFGASVGNTNLNMRRYSGGIEIQNMGQVGTDTMSLEGDGALIINANCVGGTIAVRGNFRITDNSGSVTIAYDDDTLDLQSILIDTGTTLPAVLGTPTGADLATDIASVKSDTGSTLSLLDDPRAEPGQGSPAVNADAMTKIDYLFKAWRNKTEQTATTLSIYDDAGTTVDHKSTVSDDTTTATKGEIISGP